MNKYYYIIFLAPIGEDDIAQMFSSVANDIFFISNQCAVLKSKEKIYNIKNIPGDTQYIIIDITQLQDYKLFHCEENPEFERFMEDIVVHTNSQEDIDSVLDKISREGEGSLSLRDLKTLELVSVL